MTVLFFQKSQMFPFFSLTFFAQQSGQGLTFSYNFRSSWSPCNSLNLRRITFSNNCPRNLILRIFEFYFNWNYYWTSVKWLVTSVIISQIPWSVKYRQINIFESWGVFSKFDVFTINGTEAIEIWDAPNEKFVKTGILL